MAFTYRETQIVKGMLARGDKQHDIAAFFGVNGGRIAEVSTGASEYAAAPALPEGELPSEGPYPSPYGMLKARTVLEETTKLIGSADDSDVKKIAISQIYKALDLM